MTDQSGWFVNRQQFGVFMDHFQDIAHGHFTVRRLERRYGLDAVQAAYQSIDASPGV